MSKHIESWSLVGVVIFSSNIDDSSYYCWKWMMVRECGHGILTICAGLYVARMV
jgi:hypothetical protein